MYLFKFSQKRNEKNNLVKKKCENVSLGKFLIVSILNCMKSIFLLCFYGWYVLLFLVWNAIRLQKIDSWKKKLRFAWISPLKNPVWNVELENLIFVAVCGWFDVKLGHNICSLKTRRKVLFLFYWSRPRVTIENS